MKSGEWRISAKEGKSQMPNVNAAKQVTRFSKPSRWILNHMPRGIRIKLREDVYQHVRQREWILDRIDGEGVHLLHETKAYGLIVKAEDIDWTEFQGRSAGRNQFAASERRGF